MKTGYKTKIVEKLEEENAELKRMLKLAVEDIHNRSYCGMCENGIPIDNDVCDRCKAITLDMFEWRHKAEAMKLIENCESKLNSATETINKLVEKNGKITDFEIQE